MAKKRPVLSVIIPIYNIALYLDECLASVERQGFSADQLEVLMINDGSTDGSDTIAEKWSNRHKNFILINQPNGGLSTARNTGLDHATGDYIVFLDSDDIVPDGAYRAMLEIVQKTGSDFITGPAYRFSTKNRHPWGFNRNIDLFQKSQTKLKFTEHPEFIRDFGAWNKIYRRSFFIKSGVRFPDGHIYEEIATSPLLYDKALTFDVYQKPAYYWRVTPGGITQTIKPVKALDRLRSLEHIQDYFLKEDCSDLVRNELGFAIVDYNLRWIFLDLYKFDSKTQLEALFRAQAILQRIDNSDIDRVQSPISSWAHMAKENKVPELLKILKKRHEVENAPINQNPVKNQRRLTLSKIASAAHRRLQKLFRHVKDAAWSFFVYYIFQPINKALPVKNNYAVFSCIWGWRFSNADGPAAIMQRLVESKNSKITRIVVFADKKKKEQVQQDIRNLISHDPRVRLVDNYSLAYYYYLWRAGYLFNDVNFLLGYHNAKFIERRPGQIEVQTSHGIPLKKMGLDSEEAINRKYLKTFLTKNQRYTHLVASSPAIAKQFSKAHAISPEILKTGLPQNDFLFKKQSAKEISDTRAAYGLDQHKKIVLYAPTFRYKKGNAFRYMIDFARLHKTLGDDYQIVIKTHHFNHTHLQMTDFVELTDQAEQPSKSPFIKLLGEIRSNSTYAPVTTNDTNKNSVTTTKFIAGDINQLMLAADMMITDYSSTMFNYMHLDKPIIFFTPDIEFYNSTRGIYYNIDEIAPGAVTKNTEELADAIKLASNDGDWAKAHAERITWFKNHFLKWEKGGASEKILRKLNLISD